MNNISILECVRCRGRLIKHKNNLRCNNCSKDYDVVDEIPILIDKKDINKHLRNQIRFFENENLDEKYYLDDWCKSYLNKFNFTFPNIKNKTVLDCGTGSGYMAIELAKKGANIIALDITLKNLLILKNIASKDISIAKKIKCICCSAEKIPLKDSCIDYVIANAIIEHLPNDKKSIKEFIRLGKNNSGVMIATPIKYKYIFPLFIPINYFHDKNIGHLRRYDEKSLIMLTDGWNIIKSYYTGHVSKVFKILINKIIPIYDTGKVEFEDQDKQNVKMWSSNIISFFTIKKT